MTIHRIDGSNDHTTACGIRREPPYDQWPDHLELTTPEGWTLLASLDDAPDPGFNLPDFELCRDCKGIYRS